MFKKPVRTAIIPFLYPALLAANAPTQNAATQTEAEGTICVGGSHWRPTFEESRRIHDAPVPQSYRRLFESTAPCTRWGLDEAAIVDWHMRFGDEASIAAALTYLDHDYTSKAPAPERYPILLQRAFRAALPDLQRASRMEQPKELDYSVRYRFLAQSRSARKLEELLDVRKRYIFLAQQYLRAAEEFDSLALLAKADLYLQPAVDGTRYLEPLEKHPPVKGLLHFNLHTHLLDDFRARAALRKAHITRRQEDIDRARSILQSLENPSYKQIAQAAFSGGNDFCDISDGWNEAEQLAAACRDDDYIQDKVVNYWINRASFDLLVAGKDALRAPGKDLAAIEPAPEDRRSWSESFDLATGLLAFGQLPDRLQRGRRTVNDDMLRLLLLKADLLTRRLRSKQGKSEDWERGGHWTEALDTLRNAEKLAPPYAAPGRFTRIAERWLGLWNTADRLVPQDDERLRFTQNPDFRRYARYLGANLADIAAHGSAPRSVPADFESRIENAASH